MIHPNSGFPTALPSSPTNLVPNLGQLPGFGPDDIIANSAGRLTLVQAASVRSDLRGTAVGAIVAAVFAGFFWFSASYLGAIIATVGVMLCLSEFLKGRSDLTKPIIEVYEGDVSIELDDEGPDHLRAGGLKLRLPSKAASVFRPGGPYRIFYLNQTRRVVAGEALPGWRQSPPAKRRFPFSIEIG